MLILDATNKSIQVLMDVAAATTNPDYVTSYADVTTSAFTPGVQDGALNGVTPVTVASSPAASTQRQIKDISIQNRDSIGHIITVNYIDGANTRRILSWVLGINDVLIYTDQRGWIVLNSTGSEIINSPTIRPSRYLPGSIDAADLGSNITLTSGTSYAIYLGCAAFNSSSISLRFRVTTASATITYAEVGIFKGSINLGGNPTLTRLGTLDVSGVVNSTGIKTATVSLSTPCNPGDDIWAVFGDSATTTWILRSGLADDIQSGVYATLSGRPSTVTSPTAWTLAGSTIALIWVTGYLN